MSFSVTIITNKQYYTEAYEEIVSSLRFKKYVPAFSGLMIVVVLGLYFYDTNKVLGLFPIVLLLLGVYEFLKFYYEKWKWVKDCLDGNAAGASTEFEFYDTHIVHKGPFSKGELLWSGLNDIVKTKRGILLKPAKGMSIYLPDRLFSNKAEIDYILSKRN